MCLRYIWLPQWLTTSCQCGRLSLSRILCCTHMKVSTHFAITKSGTSLLGLSSKWHTKVIASRTALPILKNKPACLNVAARGIWGRWFDSTLIYIRVFNPYAALNHSTSLRTCYAKYEKEKKRTYEQEVFNIELAPFVPVVLSSIGGMSKCASTLYKRIASMQSSKTNEQCNKIIAVAFAAVSDLTLWGQVSCGFMVQGRSSLHLTHLLQWRWQCVKLLCH